MLMVTRTVGGVTSIVWEYEAQFCQAVADFIKAVDERGVSGTRKSTVEIYRASVLQILYVRNIELLLVYDTNFLVNTNFLVQIGYYVLAAGLLSSF